MKQLSQKLVLLVLTALLVAVSEGCGPVVRKTAELDTGKIQVIAVLPPIVESEIARERIDYIRNGLKRELETSGYIVLDDAVVRKLCREPSCPEQSQLADRHGVDALVSIRLRSISRTNFLAGYYNTIDGDVRLLDAKSGKELLAVEHTEREKGGLIFSSGQVVQGLIQSVENTADDSFNRLAERYAKAVVEKMPKPVAGASIAKVSDVSITTINLTPLGSARFQLCAVGNPNSVATLVIGKIKAPLREGRPGQYCGVFLGDGLVAPGGQMMVELRSPYGVRDQQNVDTAPLLACSFDSSLRPIDAGRGSGLDLRCDEGLKGEQSAACQNRLALCGQSELLIYRADNLAGPFRKIAEVNQTPWIDKKPKSGGDTVYAIMAVSKNGVTSLPVTLQESKQ